MSAAESSMEEKSRRPSLADGEQVSKKTSSNGKITLYVGRRTFVDFGGKGNTVDGVVYVDQDFLGPNQSVFVHILAAFKYGREDRDVLGVNFQKDLFLSVEQVCPRPEGTEEHQRSRLQDRIMRRFKGAAYPFWFDLPSNTPASVTVQPADPGTNEEEEEQIPCGVDYEIRAYAAEFEGAKPLKGASVSLAIRRFVAIWPSLEPLKPVEITEEFKFMLSDGALKVTAALNKEIYVHGESVYVSVTMDNESTKTVRGIEIIVRQFAEISLADTVKYKRNVETKCSAEGFPLDTGEKLEKHYEVQPSVCDLQGLALDGKMKREKSNLAASTIINHNVGSKENFGIVVSYQVKVKMIMSMAQNVSIELPFTLTHAIS